MKKIVFVVGDNISVIPPVYSTMLRLVELGYEITLITKGINNFWENELRKRGIKYFLIKSNFIKQKRINQILFRLLFQFQLKKILQKIENFDLLWIDGARTLISLRPSFLKRYKFAFQILELYDTHTKIRNKLKWYFQNSDYTFVPEFTRANIFKMWYKLEKLPTVIVNSPYEIPIQNTLSSFGPKTSQIIKLIEEKRKIILYQGSLGAERNIDNIARFVDTLAEEFILVIMGPKRGVNSCLSISPKVFYIGEFAAPEHLLITRHAFIGVLGYLGVHMNNLFCAPNKLYEYAKFGIPMLGNDIPGLYYPFKLYGAGETSNFNDISEIKTAFYKLTNNYDNYSAGALKLYLTENQQLMKNLESTLTF